MARNTALRAANFRAWFKANLRDYASDIAAHGADAGFPWITYNSDAARLFDRYGTEIWEWLAEDAAEFGADNVAAFMAGFKRADMLETLETTKTLVVWYAAERCAQEMGSSS